MISGRHLLLSTYPPSFRERYGYEFVALLDDTGLRPRTIVDVAGGALRVWIRPVYGPDPRERQRLRLLSSVSTV